MPLSVRAQVQKVLWESRAPLDAAPRPTGGSVITSDEAERMKRAAIESEVREYRKALSDLADAQRRVRAHGGYLRELGIDPETIAAAKGGG